MTTRTFPFTACLAAFALAWLPAVNLSAQSVAEQDTLADESFQLVLNYRQTNETRLASHQRLIEPIGLQPNERLEFTVEVPTSKAGYPVAIGALDGGQIISDSQGETIEVSLSGNGATSPTSLVVPDDGLLGLSFQAGSTRGLYRLLVSVGADQYELQLYVIDPNRSGAFGAIVEEP